MEFFGFFVPVWVLFLVYVIGMPLIGLPMGKWSLRSWKSPWLYPAIGGIMFPINRLWDSIGILEYDDEGGSNLPLSMHVLDIDNALHNNEMLTLAVYLVIQMTCWPMRIIYTVIANAFIFVVSTPTYAAKILLRCKRCVEI